MADGPIISEKPKGLYMRLPAMAENVAVVRHALAGLAEQIGMDETGVADLKTVVTEACMNVVVHAYPRDDPGLLEVEAEQELEGLTVVVRDYGMGIRPRPDVERPSLRIGLTLIAALSQSFEIKGGVDRGTEIRMHLPLRARQEDGAAEPAPGEAPEAREETAMKVRDPDLLAPILSRTLAALAARREVSVDRLSDAMLISDAISAGAPRGFKDGQVCLGIADRDDGVEPELGGTLETLADEVRVEQGEDGAHFLVIAIAALSV